MAEAEEPLSLASLGAALPPDGSGGEDGAGAGEGVDTNAEEARWMADICTRENVYAAVVKDYPTAVGKQVSKKERDETDNHANTLVYGEISYTGLGLALWKIRKRYGIPGAGHCDEFGIMQEPSGGVFYDLGSGTGKGAVVAATVYPFSYAGGVEILEGLHSVSLEVAHKFQTTGVDMLGYSTPVEMEFVRGDFTDLAVKDWTNADVLFANSTCFDDRLMGAIARCASKVKKGAFFITFTKRIPSTDWQVLESELYQMSWGGATVYIQQKKTEPGAAGDEFDDEEEEDSDEDSEDEEDEEEQDGEFLANTATDTPAEGTDADASASAAEASADAQA